MSYWGVAIPGLAMRNTELPVVDGLHVLENPEIGEGISLISQYTLEDVAEIHAASIVELIPKYQSKLIIVGMSMGGMICSVLAAHFRAKLPIETKFRFLVTAANSSDLPAIPENLLSTWTSVTPGVLDDFEVILAPFFSRRFRESNPQAVEAYYCYRAIGQNQQIPKSFIRQMNALRAFDGTSYFSQIDPEEAEFIGGSEDYVLGPRHNVKLKELAPGAYHKEVLGLGHMVNLEMPGFFQREIFYGKI